MSRILVTGSIAYDLLLQYEGSFAEAIQGDIDRLSVSFFMPHFAKHHGGTAANIAWHLKLLNQDPLVVGTVGSDGGAYTALLEERGINTDHVEVLRDHVTATAVIGTDEAARQIAFFHPGADAHGTWPELADDRDDLAFAIVSPRDATAMLRAVAWCQEYKVPYLFDPGQQVIAIPPDRLKRAIKGSSGVIANAYEWSLLSEKLSCSVDQLLALTPMLIVTQGEEGLIIHTKGNDLLIPAAKPEKMVNPTGAGDALRAGLLTGMAAGWSLVDAGRLGAVVASFVVEQEGTLLDHLDLNDVLGRAEVTYGEVLPVLP